MIMEAVRAAAFFILGKWRSWITAALVKYICRRVFKDCWKM